MRKRVFLVGAMKAGTTTLYDYLGRHPSIFNAAIKEPQYITWATLKEGGIHRRPDVLRRRAVATSVIPVRSLASYEDQYEGAHADQWILDASVFNLPHPPAAKAIKDRYPDAKIIILLREMIARALSSYRFQRSKGAEWAPTFEMAIDEELSGKRSGHIYPWRNVLCSQYGDQVERYLRMFGDKNVHIALFDDFITNRNACLAQISNFLSIDPFLNVEPLHSNVTFGEPAGPLSAKVSELIYRPNLAKTVIRSFLPMSVRKACSNGIKRRIPRKSHNEPIAAQVLERLGNILIYDEQRIQQLTGLRLEINSERDVRAI